MRIRVYGRSMSVLAYQHERGGAGGSWNLAETSAVTCAITAALAN
jgi:hypothetical protein